jgi:hypothetical protein
MSTEQTLLFIAVMALSLALVLVLTVPRLRRFVTSVAGSSRAAALDGAGQAPFPRPSGSGPTFEGAGVNPIPAVAHDQPEPEAGGGCSTDAAALPAAREAGPGVGLATDGAASCPSCRRRYPPGFRFCPVDARPLTLAGEVTSVAGSGLERLRCRECRRLFLADAGARFCPFDGEPLGRPLGQRAARGRPADPPPPPPPGAAIPVKICPTCSERVHTGAIQCHRDGTELVSLN